MKHEIDEEEQEHKVCFECDKETGSEDLYIPQWNWVENLNYVYGYGEEADYEADDPYFHLCGQHHIAYYDSDDQYIGGFDGSYDCWNDEEDEEDEDDYDSEGGD